MLCELFSPSLMLATPGCWACDEMGALFAGVFCGVGAVRLSSFLFLMGSAIFDELGVD
jgi:hypothetical protein